MDDVSLFEIYKDAKDGQIKCPKCGATDIVSNPKTGKLICQFCRHEFLLDVIEDDEDISQLEGVKAATGAADIDREADNTVTLKCESCGAEVVVNTEAATQSRCPWCRNILSINKKIPNGAVCDAVLPFHLSKNDARSAIEDFVNKRKFFAHPTFVREFTTENICGVYFPYMIVDINAHHSLKGIGEHLVRSYTEKNDKDSETYYDADAYYVGRDFDIVIDDLTIEASADKLDVSNTTKTTNIINSIMPFDTKNCVKFNANYLRGYTSQKRDIDIKDIQSIVNVQAADISRIAVNKTLTNYDRGVAWQNENFEIKGSKWISAYLPVWLYSYLQTSGGKKQLHYVAVNARTRETMGSIPINMTKLILVSILVEFFGVLLLMFVNDRVHSHIKWLLLLPGIVFFGIMYARYRNAGARHTYESETMHQMSNIKGYDNFMEHRRRLRSSTIEGMNNTSLKGTNTSLTNSVIEHLKDNGLPIDFLQEQAKRLDE